MEATSTVCPPAPSTTLVVAARCRLGAVMAHSWHIHRRPPTSTDVHPVGRPAFRRPPTSTDVHRRPHLSASQAENAGSIPVTRSPSPARTLLALSWCFARAPVGPAAADGTSMAHADPHRTPDRLPIRLGRHVLMTVWVTVSRTRHAAVGCVGRSHHVAANGASGRRSSGTSALSIRANRSRSSPAYRWTPRAVRPCRYRSPLQRSAHRSSTRTTSRARDVPFGPALGGPCRDVRHERSVCVSTHLAMQPGTLPSGQFLRACGRWRRDAQALDEDGSFLASRLISGTVRQPGGAKISRPCRTETSTSLAKSGSSGEISRSRSVKRWDAAFVRRDREQPAATLAEPEPVSRPRRQVHERARLRGLFVVVDAEHDLAVDHVEGLIPWMGVRRRSAALGSNLTEDLVASRLRTRREDGELFAHDVERLLVFTHKGERCERRAPCRRAGPPRSGSSHLLRPGTCLLLWDLCTISRVNVCRQEVPPDSSGRVNQKRRTRSAIVAAAQAIVERGETPTVAQAANDALVSRTTAYRYFPTQESLLLELSVTIDIREVEDLVAQPLDGTKPEDRLLEFVDLFNRHVLANERLYRTGTRHYMDMWLAADRAGDDHPYTREGRRAHMIAAILEPLRHTIPERGTPTSPSGPVPRGRWRSHPGLTGCLPSPGRRSPRRHPLGRRGHPHRRTPTTTRKNTQPIVQSEDPASNLRAARRDARDRDWTMRTLGTRQHRNIY